MVDLIPQDYRRARRLRGWMRVFCVACAAILASVGIARGAIAYLARAERVQMSALRQVEVATGAERARLAELNARREEAERQVKVLDILRGRAVIGELFFAIDAAASGRLWINDLSFMREGEVAEAKPEARESGYFILIPQDRHAGAARGGQPEAGRAWRAEQRVEIRGQALDHSALAGFIRRLGEQPGMGTVRLVDTRARSYTGAQVLDFQLAAVLGQRAEAPR